MKTLPLLAAALLFAAPALAQQTGQTAVGAPNNASELRNKLDGDSNIAGTDEAIAKSDIPMEGAVADTMGEALALDQATDCAGEGLGGQMDAIEPDGTDCIRVDPTEVGATDRKPDTIIVAPKAD